MTASTSNSKLQAWVKEWADIFQPADILRECPVNGTVFHQQAQLAQRPFSLLIEGEAILTVQCRVFYELARLTTGGSPCAHQKVVQNRVVELW